MNEYIPEQNMNDFFRDGEARRDVPYKIIGNYLIGDKIKRKTTIEE